MTDQTTITDQSETPDDAPEWLPLGKAAALLGVHNMTLRRWSDSGRFPSYRTAGGHRRFRRDDIQAYLARQKSMASGSISANWADTALVQTRQQVAHHEDHRWLRAITDEDMRGEYRQLGHQLMGLLLQYVATEEPNGTFIDEARRMGQRYGSYGKRAGLSLTNILEATLFFRDILIESTLQVPATTYVEPENNLRILRRVNQIINTIQLSVTSFYELGGEYPTDIIEP